MFVFFFYEHFMLFCFVLFFPPPKKRQKQNQQCTNCLHSVSPSFYSFPSFLIFFFFFNHMKILSDSLDDVVNWNCLVLLAGSFVFYIPHSRVGQFKYLWFIFAFDPMWTIGTIRHDWLCLICGVRSESRLFACSLSDGYHHGRNKFHTEDSDVCVCVFSLLLYARCWCLSTILWKYVDSESNDCDKIIVAIPQYCHQSSTKMNGS